MVLAIVRLAALGLALSLSFATNAHADWADDSNQIQRLVRAGEYVAAEKAADESLKRGPGGFLFSGTGTLTIHYWRGRLRLLLGNTAGAIEDADALIKGASFLIPADMGYALRAVARAVNGDVTGAQSDFDAALKAAASGIVSRFRTLGVISERAVVKLLLNDLPGAEADFAQAIAGEQSGLGLDDYIRARREAWTNLRAATGKLTAGDAQAAKELAQTALNTFKNTKGTAGSADFVSAQLVLNELGRRDSALPAAQAAAPVADEPARPVDPALIALMTTGPKQTSSWGVQSRDAEGGGVLFGNVMEGSPAGKAGLRPNDVLLSINGKSVQNEKDWLAQRDTLPLFTPLRLGIRRDGNMTEATITVPGKVRLKVQPIDRLFEIPGSPPPPTGKLTAVEALDAFNVLERIIIDPRTGRVAVIGRYDPQFNTGPIPYLDLLKTAVANPTPNLNIKPTPATKKLLEDLRFDFTAKLRNWPFAEMVDHVQGHPGLERDRQLMIRELSRLYGITPEEYAAWYDFARLDVQRDGYTELFPPPALREAIVKAHRTLGHNEIATALPLLYQRTPQAAEQALRALGRGDEAAAIVARGGSSEDVYGALAVSAWLAISELNASAGPETRATLRKYVDEKRITWQDALRTMQSVMPYQPKGARFSLMHQAFHRITLSNAAGVLAFPSLDTARSYIEPIDMPPDSQLARVMFEADYAFKSFETRPELFAHIPGYTQKAEHRLTNPIAGDMKSARIWMEPKSIQMTVAPGRNVIDFGTAQMVVRTVDGSDVLALEAKDADKPDPYMVWITNHLMARYDDYARVIPAFHKVREAAKVIALAQWMRAEKLNIDLADAEQTRWDNPGTFPLNNLISQSFRVLPNGSTQLTTYLVTEGGVTFKPRGNWTTVTPSVVSETRAVDHLSLSAGLGQQAVRALGDGNMEQARYLAELSAQAMNGSLSRADLGKLNIAVPDVKGMTAVPTNVQLQKEIIRNTSRQIERATQDPGLRDAVSAAAVQLGNLYNDVQSNPASASDYLLKLQTGQIAAAPVVAKPAAPVPVIPPVPAPTVADQGGPIITPITPSGGACTVTLAQGETVPPEQKAYLNNKLAEARNRLRYINEALKKLGAINASQRAEIEKMTNEISKDYEAATERAYDFAVSTLTDLPLAKYADIHTTRIKFLENSIKGQNLARTAPMSDAMRKAMELDIMQMTALKDHYVEAFSSTEKMLALYAGANYGKDVYKWNEDTRDSGDWKRGWEATRLGAKILLDHPWLEKYLDQKDWFGGDKLWQVVAMGKMAWTASDFFWDIMNQYGAWQPLANSLLKDLQFNAQAMDQLRLKAQKTSREIDCIQKLVQK